MTNETRTLLLNLLPWTGSDRPPGEEYVPIDYVPRALAGTLSRARIALFGDGADRGGMNLTLARILTYLHASSFFQEIVAADSRITYDPLNPTGPFDVIGPSASGPDPIVGWSGASEFDATGRSQGNWSVTPDGSGSATVTSTDRGPVTGPVDATGSGDTVWLPGSSLGVVLPGSNAGTWTVELIVPPTHSFVSAADLPSASALFRPSTPGAESRWARLWLGDGPALDRAAALAMALAARTRELGA